MTCDCESLVCLDCHGNGCRHCGGTGEDRVLCWDHEREAEMERDRDDAAREDAWEVRMERDQ